MVLRYYDADGKEITKTQWGRLYRQKGYGDPLVHRQPGYEVRLCWVGVVSLSERPAGHWLAEANEVDPDGRKTPWGRPVWAASRRAAEEAFNQMVAALPPVKTKAPALPSPSNN